MQQADRLLSALFDGGGGGSPLDSEQQQQAEGGSAEQQQQQWGAYDEELGELDAEGGGGGGGGLDMDASPAEVVRRIRSAALWFVNELSEGRLPDVELASNATSNRSLHAAGGGDGGDESEGGGGPFILRPTQLRSLRSLLRPKQPESADQVARLWVLLQLVHELLLAGQTATQRELWYRVKTMHELFRSPRDVTEAAQDAVSMLQVPRSALGITASSKGLVAGRLTIHDRRSGAETDCAAAGFSAGGVPIPGDPARIAADYQLSSDAELVLVIEKDAVFQRLARQRFFDTTPCVLVTGKGMPDLGTRAFLHHLASAFPELPLVGLVDWNPHGVTILCTYRFGSGRMGLEAPRYALPSLGWLGARSTQLQGAHAGEFQELTPRDQTIAANLAASLSEATPGWAAELRAMLSSGSKAELEALDSAAGGGGLPALLQRCLEEGDCV